MKGLAIKEVAERTGIAAATIRMWEQRYGFPEPARTASGYRVYTDEDVDALRARRARCRDSGLSVPAALERARGRRRRQRPPVDLRRDRQRATTPIPARRLRKATLLAISRAIEDETLARAAGAGGDRRLPVGAQLRGGRAPLRAAGPQRRRVRRVRRLRRACASAPATRPRSRSRPEDALGNEWAVVVDAPGYAACLLAWETPESQRDDHLPDRERRFEALWTLDPRIGPPRGAGRRGARRPRAAGARRGGSRALLRDRPLGVRGAGAGAHRADEPDRRLPGLSSRAPDERADAGRLGEAELLGGGLGEVPGHALDERARGRSPGRRCSRRRRRSRPACRTAASGGRRRRGRA